MLNDASMNAPYLLQKQGIVEIIIVSVDCMTYSFRSYIDKMHTFHKTIVMIVVEYIQ